jgi:3-oxoacyl-[acyl-carrier protein] reductase
MYDLSGKVALITGAGRGIGRAIAHRLAKEGADIVVSDIQHESAHSVTNEIIVMGREAIACVADVTKADQVQRMTDHALNRFGRIDVLVNNAGLLRDGVVWKLSDEDWESVLAVHLGGTFRFTRACTPHFRERNFGRIVNVTSYTGIRGNVGQANYGAAKAGIIGLTKTTAKELARFGITVNAISPNAATRMIDSIPDDKKAELAAAIPISRWGEPAEMCPAIGFLASAEASYITGVVLPVDGGLSM